MAPFPTLSTAALPLLLALLPSPSPFGREAAERRIVVSGNVGLGGATAWRVFTDGLFQEGGTGEGFKIPYGESLVLHSLSATLPASDRRHLIQVDLRLAPAMAGDFPLARITWRHRPGAAFSHTQTFRPPLVIPSGASLVLEDRSAHPARFEVLLQGYLTR